MKKNILLVEESKSISFLIGTLLHKDYDTIRVSESNYAMLELLSGKRFDLAILSIDSIESETFELLRHMSSSSLYKTIPVLVLSNSFDNQLQEACWNAGITGFLQKPFDPVVFVQKTGELSLVQQSNKKTRKRLNFFNLN
jgi:response regulator RpfG family c-di-GMP phosphodiesterase